MSIELLAACLLRNMPNLTEDYHEYLNSNAWKTQRKWALIRANNQCERCGAQGRLGKKGSIGYSMGDSLDVHHKTYENFKDEQPDDLIVLCRSCHEIEDENRRLQKRTSRF